MARFPLADSAPLSTDLEQVVCDLCSGAEAEFFFRERDYRFGLKENYTFVRCTSCGLIYMNPRPAERAIQDLYESEYAVDQPSSFGSQIGREPGWKEALKRFWHKLNGQYLDEVAEKLQGQVLDVGCGTGELLFRLKRGCVVFGVETNPRAVAVCRQRALEVFCGELEEAKFPEGFFDAVVMSQVIEHVPSPTRALLEVRRILKEGGKAFLFCPNGESCHLKVFGKYWQGWHIPFHFYVFMPRTIARLAEQCGFKVACLRTTTPDSFFVTSIKSMLYGNRKGVRAIDRGKWLDSFWFRGAVAPFLRLLDWTWQARGDCLKVVLVKP